MCKNAQSHLVPSGGEVVDVLDLSGPGHVSTTPTKGLHYETEVIAFTGSQPIHAGAGALRESPRTLQG